MEKIIVSSSSKSSSIRIVYKNSMFLVVQVNSLALTANCRFAEAEVKAPICPGIRKISILSLGRYVFRHMHDVVGNNNQRSQTVSTNGFREIREASRPCSVQGSSTE